jgi:hypothetical protein
LKRCHLKNVSCTLKKAALQLISAMEFYKSHLKTGFYSLQAPGHWIFELACRNRMQGRPMEAKIQKAFRIAVLRKWMQVFVMDDSRSVLKR